MVKPRTEEVGIFPTSNITCYKSPLVSTIINRSISNIALPGLPPARIDAARQGSDIPLNAGSFEVVLEPACLGGLNSIQRVVNVEIMRTDCLIVIELKE